MKWVYKLFRGGLFGPEDPADIGPLPEFINKGGHKDEHGRVFVVELRAAEWYAMHAGCLPQHVTVNAKWMERT